MKIDKMLSRCLVLLGTSLILPTLNGCSQQMPYRTAANISYHSTSVQKSSHKVAGRVDHTMASLAALIHKPSGKLRAGFDRFSGELSSLKSGCSHLTGAISKVTGAQANYMAAWEKHVQGISNPDIAAAARGNYHAAQSDFSRFSKRAKTTETAGGKLIAYLYNMKKYLASDLSADGLKGAAKLLGKAKSHAAIFKHDLVKLEDDSVRLAGDLRPAVGAT